MTLAEYLLSKIKKGIISFVHLVSLANKDYPYFDYKTYADTEEPEMYNVGKDSITGESTQHKLFVSKSTLIIADVDCTIQFNNTNNVVVDIIADILFTFKHNIHAVNVLTIGAGGNIYMYFEGVLPNEARNPE